MASDATPRKIERHKSRNKEYKHKMNMKRLKLFFVAALCATVAVSCEKKAEEAKTAEVIEVPEYTPDSKMPIAYVNIDTILAKYTVAVEANDRLVKQQEDARLELNEKAKKLQTEVNEFQRKLENNAFLSRERAEQEAQRLQKKESDLQAREQKLTQDLMEEQQTLSIQLRNDIDNAIKEYNHDGRYHLILSTSVMQETVIFSVGGYDISNDILTLLNSKDAE